MNRPSDIQVSRDKGLAPSMGIYLVRMLSRFIAQISRRCIMKGDIKRGSEWIARLHADDASEQDRELFEKWRSSHPSHAQAYDEMHTTWSMITRTKIVE